MSPMTESRLRPVLWLVLIVSLAANAVTSSIGATVPGIVCGVVAVACAVTLGVHHYRSRRGSDIQRSRSRYGSVRSR